MSVNPPNTPGGYSTQSTIIEAVISPEGDVELHVTGLKGKSCTHLTQPIEDALGTVTKRTLTREFHEMPAKAIQGVRQRS